MIFVEVLALWVLIGVFLVLRAFFGPINVGQDQAFA